MGPSLYLFQVVGLKLLALTEQFLFD